MNGRSGSNVPEYTRVLPRDLTTTILACISSPDDTRLEQKGAWHMFEMKQSRPPIYDPAAVQPMRDELTWVGFEELWTPEMVDAVLGDPNGTVLFFINSVCGCAAGSARPGVTLALQNEVIPDRLVTVFAGQERDAVDRIREHLPGYPPSSPFAVLFRDGVPVLVLQRFEIEGRHHQEIAGVLVSAFRKHCTRPGPSITREKYNELVHTKTCGSKIPRRSE